MTRALLLTLGLLVARVAYPVDLAFEGQIEAGYTYSWQRYVNETQWLVDSLRANATIRFSERARLHFDNAISVGRNSAPFLGTLNNSSGYYSSAQLSSNAVAKNSPLFILSNLATSLDFDLLEEVSVSVGHLMTPFGMESMSSRYDMPTYYYSRAYSAAVGIYHWLYDYGVKVTVSKALPGVVEVALVDARANGNSTPGFVGRVQLPFTVGDVDCNAVASTYLANWNGDAWENGSTLGMFAKWKPLSLRTEWVHTDRREVFGFHDNYLDSVYVEPSYDFEILTASMKGEYFRPAADDMVKHNWSLAAALSRDFDDFRIRLTYQYLGGAWDDNDRVHDLRILFGTKW